MFAEIGAELAKLEKNRLAVQLKQAHDERARRQTTESHHHENLEVLETAFRQIAVSFNAESDRSMRLSVRNTPEALMISRGGGTIIWLRVSATKLYYRAPARDNPVVSYHFIVERGPRNEIIFYPGNLPKDRMNVTEFVAAILKHALNLPV